MLTTRTKKELDEKITGNQLESNFNLWWSEYGSGITPQGGDDKESHAKQVAFFSFLACFEMLIK